MQKKPNTQYRLAAIVILLMLLSFTTGVFASKLLLKIDNTVPIAMIEIDAGETDSVKEDDSSENSTENNTDSNEENNQNNTEQSNTTSSTTHTSQTGKYGMEVSDGSGTWAKGTNITLFKASYENESGEVTVQSANGDAVIAPGTMNRYEFRVCNTGSEGITYQLKTTPQLVCVVDGEVIEIPLEMKLYTADGKYLIGTENSYADMNTLEAVEHSGELFAGHYTKYVLEWQWPFEGNDEYDTLIGDLYLIGASGTTDIETGVETGLTVAMQFDVYASADSNAEGGLPQTGDSNNIGIWMMLGVSSFVMLIILLFGYKRKDNEETAK